MGRTVTNVPITIPESTRATRRLDSSITSAKFTLRGAGGGGGGSAVSQGWSLWEGTVHKRSGGGGGGQGGLLVWDYSKANHQTWFFSKTVGSGGGGGNGSWTTNDQLASAGNGSAGGGTSLYMKTAANNDPIQLATAYGGNGGQGGTAKASGAVTDGNGGSGGNGYAHPIIYGTVAITSGAGGNNHSGCGGGSGGGASGAGKGGDGASACDKENYGVNGTAGSFSCVGTAQYWYAYAKVNNSTCTVTMTSAYYYDSNKQTATTNSTTVDTNKWVEVGEGHSVTYGISISDSNHYEFDGWYDVNGNKVSENTTFTVSNLTGDVTYEARVRRYVFDIKYEYNCPAGTTQCTKPGPFEYTSNGSGTSTALGRPERAYCTFLGWYNNAELTGSPITSISSSDSGNKIYFAKWSGNVATITYNYNINSAGSTITGNGTASVKIQYKTLTSTDDPNLPSAATLPSPETTGGDYRFYGWYDNSEFTNQRWAANSPYTGGYVNRTLYARWYTCELTIEADLRGGTGLAPSETRIIRPGAQTTVTLWAAPEREGQYQFQVWAENPDGTGTQGNPGDEITITAPTGEFSYTKTFYAIWNDLYDVVIKFHPNGGYWEDENAETPDTEVRVYRASSIYPAKTINIFTAADDPLHTRIDGDVVNFLGWGTSTNDRTADYTHNGTETYVVTAASEYPASRVIEFSLYAVWTGIQVITFVGKIVENPPTGYPAISGDAIISANDLFEGFNTAELETYPSGRLRAVPISIANRYLFDDWWTDPIEGRQITSNGTVVSQGSQDWPGVMIDDRFLVDVTLYAHWIPQAYVTFNTNGIPTLDETVLATNKQRKLDKFPVTSNVGNYFITGWFTSPTGGEEKTVDDPFYEDTTLYAHWVASYKITFNANGGFCSTTSMLTNGTYRLPQYPTAVRAGYTMDTKDGTTTGWYYADNPAIPVQTGTMYMNNRTLIAKWIPKTYTLTFDANGGTYEGGSETVQWTGVVFGQSYNAIPNQSATRDFPIPTSTSRKTFIGYSLNKYDTETEFTPVLVSPDSIFNDERSVLYAVWKNGRFAITFNPMGGGVVPPRSITNINGVISYYPTPERLGYNFIGWYLWPVYNSTEMIPPGDDDTVQTRIWEAYYNVSGLRSAPPNTLLVNAYDVSIKQYQFSGTRWNDVTEYAFQTYYYETDVPESEDPLHPDEPYILDDNGQSDMLTKAWQSTRDYAGWEQYEGSDTPDVTYGSFDNLTELIASADVPRNNDIAKVGSSTYYVFNIPFGVTYVVVREDEKDDAAYTWKKDNSAVVIDPDTEEEFFIGGKWVNTTNDDATVILPFKTFSSDTMVYAHWELAPEPSSLSNTCYIERRLSKYGDDSVRMYLPTVTSIEDTITSNLIQKDTLMFGYENKFISDLGNSRRLIVSVERANPMPYDDLSGNPDDWSNGKWYKSFLDFTNYWQNYGRDTITGSMIGGFRFVYTPKVSAKEDERVEYGELYPVIDKNVFLTGNTNVTFSDTLMKFTMNLAIGQMTTDANSLGYEIRLTPMTGDEEKNEDVIINTPQGIDVMVPDRPLSWKVPKGKMFGYWTGPGTDGGTVRYNPGDFVKYTVAKTYRDEKQGKFFTLSAVWVDVEACLMMTLNPSNNYGEKQSHIGDISHIVTEPTYKGDGKYELTFLSDAIVEATVIGGGGGGAGGYSWTKKVSASRTSVGWFDSAVNETLSFLTETMTGSLLMKEVMTSGGAGGSGYMGVFTISVSAGDKFICEIGRPGGTDYDSNVLVPEGGLYRDGQDGESTTVYLTRNDTSSAMKPYAVKGGTGGKRDGKGGGAYMSGGTGGNCEEKKATRGTTATVKPRGIVGEPGNDYDAPFQDAGAQTYWSGGAGGGAAPLNRQFCIGNNYLRGGNGRDDTWFVSNGGNGASNGKSATQGMFGGGGGSGCAGYRYNMGGYSAVIGYSAPFSITNLHIPAPGGPGAVFLQIRVR